MISMLYTNWRGETALRHIRPIEISFGSTEWHPEPGYILTAMDLDKHRLRDFALKDCDFTVTQP